MRSISIITLVFSISLIAQANSIRVSFFKSDCETKTDAADLYKEGSGDEWPSISLGNNEYINASGSHTGTNLWYYSIASGLPQTIALFETEELIPSFAGISATFFDAKGQCLKVLSYK